MFTIMFNWQNATQCSPVFKGKANKYIAMVEKRLTKQVCCDESIQAGQSYRRPSFCFYPFQTLSLCSHFTYHPSQRKVCKTLVVEK